MKSDNLYCPNCNTQLTKSAAAWVMGETKQVDMAEYMASTVTCPRCGQGIDTRGMLEGKYDSPTWESLVAIPVWIACFVALMYFTKLSLLPLMGIATAVSIIFLVVRHVLKKVRGSE